jgi:ATP-dependent helicase/nuclease subunit B
MTKRDAGGPLDGLWWPRLAADVQAWFAARHVAARDAVVLLPFAQLLAPARAAFARAGGWQPRIETTQTLRASLGPRAAATGPGDDPVADRLAAAALLRGQAWGRAWQRRDARGFERGVAALVATAQAFARAAQAQPPAARAAWWANARALVAPVGGGPGASERALARIALEWAASADAPASDLLFALRPSAWVLLRAGALDALAEALVEQSGVPTLTVDTDSDTPAPTPPACHVADGLEDEAQAGATLVLRALQEDRAPVALIALDRLLVRRVRALLERRGVPLHDETGWTLSTTRSAARVMAALRAASPRANADAWLDWLKGETEAPADATRLDALERAWRRGEAPGEAVQRWWDAQRTRLAPLQQTTRSSLAHWLAALGAVLPRAALAADDAGVQLLAALRLDEGWGAAGEGWRGTLDDFTAWVAETLEQHTFVPPPQAGAQVVITPLARAMLRPFGAVVCPGCDAQHLGAPVPPHPLLADALLAPLGLPDAAARRLAEQRAFAQLLRLPRVALLRRTSDDGEPLAPSPLVERVLGAAALAAEARVEPARRIVAAAPVVRPAPRAAPPARLSASEVEALRICPYRFYAGSVLGLRQTDELDAELDKRDYGTWLHATLARFHATRDPRASADADLAALHAAADAAASAAALDAAQLLPYRAAFDAFAPRYLAWQRARDAQGWRVAACELACERELPALPAVRLHGRIDRIDDGPGGRVLIDYKTGGTEKLKERVAAPLEDTQLAVYAALVDATPAPNAIYLALHERSGPTEVPHPDVAASAQALLDGLAADLAQMQHGAGLAALGEEPDCDHCDMRGLCRRDHWQAE